MLDKEMSKHEIERELEGKGDFVQIDYLTRLLSQDPPLYVKKFVCLKLKEIYEGKNMFVDAAKMYDNLAELSVAFSDKVKYFIEETEMFIRAGQFDEADASMKKAMTEANVTERMEIYWGVKNFYKKQAGIYENELKRNHAAKIYEKLLEMKISDLERKEIKTKLLDLYEKLGKFKEYSVLEKN